MELFLSTLATYFYPFLLAVVAIGLMSLGDTKLVDLLKRIFLPDKWAEYANIIVAVVLGVLMTILPSFPIFAPVLDMMDLLAPGYANLSTGIQMILNVILTYGVVVPSATGMPR